MTGFSVYSDNYYIVINHTDKSCVITTNKRHIALLMGVTERSIHRYLTGGKNYHSNKWSIYSSPEVIKKKANNPF